MNKPPLSTQRIRGSAKQAPTRVRRGNEQDQQALRRQALDTAMGLFQEQGLAGVTMRGVATKVGVSAMALYRYFPSKAALLHGLWETVITELRADLMQAIEAAGSDPRARLRAWVEAFFSYYEARPDSYRLVYMLDTHETEHPDSPWADLAIYREVLQAAMTLSRDVAGALGGDGNLARIRLAGELRLSMSVGYLHSRLINTRHPWSDLPTLRAVTIDLIVQAVENCLAGDCAGSHHHQHG